MHGPATCADKTETMSLRIYRNTYWQLYLRMVASRGNKGYVGINKNSEKHERSFDYKCFLEGNNVNFKNVGVRCIMQCCST
ncbi:hypothetical protein CUMW_263600 [Citrus unshiu]|uniref:Uncharacterized protein n=1 Tax=Citrus unshiu TaxID=55188 RepID=A0A2H5QUR7_CITUN|nr:hypothetical protein CUMW_263600 [Citrus unshiu]